MATEKLSIELEAKVGKYKTDLLEAQKALLKLENEALKAGGANKKMATQISLAKNQVKLARNEYNMSAIALKQYALQTMKTSSAVTKLGSKQKKSNMAMTQAAYAIDDMQYGFQGVQNNIQAMAVSMGAGGPLIVALTLATVAIGFVVKHFQKMGKEAKEAAQLASKALADAQGPIVKLGLYADAVKSSEKNTYEFKDAMVKLKEMGFDPVNGSLDEFVTKKSAMIKLNAIESATVAAVSKKLAEQLKLQAELTAEEEKLAGFKKHLVKKDGILIKNQQKDVDELRGKVDALKLSADKLISTGKKAAKELIDEAGLTSLDVENPTGGGGGGDEGEKDGVAYSHAFLGGMKKTMIGTDVYSNFLNDIKNNLEVMKAAGADNGALLASELEQLTAIDQTTIKLEEKAKLMHKINVLGIQISNLPPLMDNFVGLDDGTAALNKFKNDLAAIREMLDGGVIAFDEYIKRVDTVTESFNKSSEAQNNMVNVGAMLEGQLTGLISGFAEAAGSGDNMGNALLKGLGNMLVQLGGLIIAAGIAALNLTIVLSNPAMAPLAIIAGAALVAAGAAVSSFANKSAGGGGGSSSAGRASSGSSSTVINNPVRENARVRNSNLIIPMDMMRYGMQNANDNYSGFN